MINLHFGIDVNCEPSSFVSIETVELKTWESESDAKVKKHNLIELVFEYPNKVFFFAERFLGCSGSQIPFPQSSCCFFFEWNVEEENNLFERLFFLLHLHGVCCVIEARWWMNFAGYVIWKWRLKLVRNWLWAGERERDGEKVQRLETDCATLSMCAIEKGETTWSPDELAFRAHALGVYARLVSQASSCAALVVRLLRYAFVSSNVATQECLNETSMLPSLPS